MFGLSWTINLCSHGHLFQPKLSPASFHILVRYLWTLDAARSGWPLAHGSHRPVALVPGPPSLVQLPEQEAGSEAARWAGAIRQSFDVINILKPDRCSLFYKL